MTLSRIAIGAALTALTLAQVNAEEYQGVLRKQSTLNRNDVRADAVAAAHGPSPYAEAAASGVAASPSSPRDRATVQAEARARSHAPNQNLRVEAFADSRIPSYYLSLDRSAGQAQANRHNIATLR